MLAASVDDDDDDDNESAAEEELLYNGGGGGNGLRWSAGFMGDELPATATLTLSLLLLGNCFISDAEVLVAELSPETSFLEADFPIKCQHR